MKKGVSPVDPIHARQHALMGALEYHCHLLPAQGVGDLVTHETILRTARVFLGFLLTGSPPLPLPPSITTYELTGVIPAPVPSADVPVPPPAPPRVPAAAPQPGTIKCTLCEPPQIVLRGEAFARHVEAHERDTAQGAPTR